MLLHIVRIDSFFLYSLLSDTMNKSELNSFRVMETTIFPHFYQIRILLGDVVDRTLPSLHGGSLEITLTVPLNLISL